MPEYCDQGHELTAKTSFRVGEGYFCRICHPNRKARAAQANKAAQAREVASARYVDRWEIVGHGPRTLVTRRRVRIDTPDPHELPSTAELVPGLELAEEIVAKRPILMHPNSRKQLPSTSGPR